jgi:hypothetical protein
MCSVTTGLISFAITGLCLLLCVVVILMVISRRQRHDGRRYKQIQLADG